MCACAQEEYCYSCGMGCRRGMRGMSGACGSWRSSCAWHEAHAARVRGVRGVCGVRVFLGGRFGYLLVFFFCSGRGKGGSEAPGDGGGRFLLGIPGGGGGFQEGKGVSRRVVRSELGNWGGGLNFFVSGPKRPPSFVGVQQCAFHEL